MNEIDKDKKLMKNTFYSVFESIMFALMQQGKKGTVFVISDHYGASFDINAPAGWVYLPSTLPADERIDISLYVEEALKNDECLGIVPITKDSEKMIRERYGLECIMKGANMKDRVAVKEGKINLGILFRYNFYHKK
jgi:hypothetical protein